MSEAKAFKRVSTFAPKPCMRCRGRQERGCRQGVKQRLKPKETASRRRWPGQGEIGRVNANESLLRLRECRSSQRLEAMTMGQESGVSPPCRCPLGGLPRGE